MWHKQKQKSQTCLSVALKRRIIFQFRSSGSTAWGMNKEEANFYFTDKCLDGITYIIAHLSKSR